MSGLSCSVAFKKKVECIFEINGGSFDRFWFKSFGFGRSGGSYYYADSHVDLCRQRNKFFR